MRQAQYQAAEGRNDYKYLRALRPHRRFRRSVRIITGALANKSRCVTSIKRADTANEKFNTVQRSPLTYSVDCSLSEIAVQKCFSQLTL